VKSVHDFVVAPKGGRYSNTKEIDGGNLILNTEIYNHQFVNREATVVSTPIVGNTDIIQGDTILVHHNVFRRWNDITYLEGGTINMVTKETVEVFLMSLLI